jgi:uncharacterized membrane protein
MTVLLTNLRYAIISGVVLAVVAYVISAFLFGGSPNLTTASFWLYPVRWAHIFAGILWIGLLYYFNFVQTPMMAKIPDDQKPAVSKFIAPEALWYFRWSAMATLVFGLLLAQLNKYLVGALTLGASEGFSPDSAPHILIGIGMWLAIIMWFNVWFVIWPNQQRALNIENRYPDLTKDQRAAHGRTAGLFSRVNFILSMPMLLCMVGASHFSIA